MERLLNDQWSFAALHNGSTLADVQAAQWSAVSLPHDFLIWNHRDLYANADGWYRRALHVPGEWLSKEVILRFDGVYMDCDVLLNGEIVCTHHYGYTAFDAVLTGKLHEGENELMVQVRHQSPNSRWYSGAGIFRDVTLHVLPLRHIPLDGVYVTACPGDHTWTLCVQTEVEGPDDGSVVQHHLLDDQGIIVVQGMGEDVTMEVEAPLLWSPSAPNLYTLETTLGEQVIRQRVGFRTYRFDVNEGLFVNGEHVKLHGVCLHHDLGALGSAFHVKAAKRQLKAMQKMGVNSLRTSHNPPARQMMELCDELGILVVDEAFDMWQRPKTTYDYARFFDADVAADVASWVRRDRNHPSLLMWSLGNEILDTHLDASAQDVTQMLARNVRLHDPRKNGATTIGSNFMPWEGAQKCAEYIDLVGYNYGEKYYEEHHASHPQWVIYGSETASALASRGIYKFPLEANYLSDEDMQCSALGNSTSSWGTKDMRMCLIEDLETPYSMGQYLWSGIDYIGEPTPYHTRSCYFGMMDTAVFPKDYWYHFKTLWNDEPMVHISVSWDWNPGQLVDVPVMTNGASVELLLNGESLGVQAVDPHRWEQSLPVWKIPFVPGELEARAYDKDGKLIAEDVRRTSGDSAQIVLSAENAFILADGEDMTFVTISMADETGNPVENAVDRVMVTVEGEGLLLGLDNGDSTDREGYKTNTRRLFSGKLLAMVGAAQKPGVMRIRVASPGKAEAVLEIPVKPAMMREGVSPAQACPTDEMPMEVPARRIVLEPMGDTHLSAEQTEVTFAVRLLPGNADPQEISYRIVNAKGIESPCAQCVAADGKVTVRALGDGEVYLRATCRNGYDHTRVISQQEISITGMGQPSLDPYGFIAGGLYDLSYGDIGSGNEQGVAFARDGESMAGYTQIDFGPVGSDEITLPIFALNAERYEIGVWLGNPHEGGEKIDVLEYQKPSIWNVYQAQTYRLSRRLTGMQTLCFTMTEKVHIKGFSFTRQSRAWVPQSALEADSVYGDSFTRTQEGVLGIGNNVSLVYEGMDFGEASRAILTLDAATSLVENPVTIHFESEDGRQLTSLAQFKGTGRGEQTFEVEVLPGVCKVSFVFLPGSQFDFYGFRFDKA